MKHLGDITKINGAEIAPVDVIIGGSPCQDLSTAGKRAGLAGARSGLFMEQIRIVKEMRNATNGTRPRFMVWENVTGALSSNKGGDFAAVIEETIRIIEPEAPRIDVPERGWPTWGQYRDVGGRWSVAWRVLDAQYWGVPQRRRRIALVADFGGSAAGEILFNRKGVSRDFEPCGETREGLATETESGADYAVRIRGGCDGGGKGALIQKDKSGTLGTTNDQTVFCLQGNGIDRADTAGCNVRGWRENQSYTLNTVDRPAVACLTPWDSQAARIYDEDGVFHTLNAGEKAGQARDGVFCAAFKPNNSAAVRSISYSEECAPTLTSECGGNKPAVAYSFDSLSSNSMKSKNPNSGCRETDIAKTLDTSDARPDKNQGGMAILDMTHANDVIRECSEIAIPINTQIATRHISLGERTGMGCGEDGDPAYTLQAGHEHAVCCLWNDQCGQSIQVEDGQVSPTMRAESHAHEPVVMCRAHGQANAETNMKIAAEKHCFQNTDIGWWNQSDVGATLRTPCGGDSTKSNVIAEPKSAVRWIVRRLTPLECERLQGFPDGWTNIGDWTDSKGKTRKTSDASRYKAIGNSIALPPWKWVLKRLCAEYERDATMGSLFDGIGGFPLIWEQFNGKGSCLWASEIEEFCIAVTKRRFGG